tara:strand:- start:3422 stop:4159 length:738 start_codon:yes stop_codon:yes gene_type:complete
MKILVCISYVPDTTSKISFKENNTRFNSEGVQYIIGPYDDYALARAVEIKEKTGSSVSVLNVGKDETEVVLRKALAIGADEAYRINEDPIDSKHVAFQISNFIKSNSYDLIMMGKESIDYNGGLVHHMVGENLEIPCINPVMKLDIVNDLVKLTREVDEGVEELEAKLPLIVGCQEPIAEWKIPNMRGIMSARSKPLNIIKPIQYNSEFKYLDFDLPPKKESVKIIDKDNLEDLINHLKNDSKVI